MYAAHSTFLTKSKRYYPQLDGIRFICAFLVVLSHIGPPTEALPHVLRSIVGVLFNGGWAVVAFFVISGFCIHLPYHSGKRLVVKKFYISRFFRIALPMFAAIGVSYLLPNGPSALDAVLWSLYCEIIYYALYPLLYKLFKLIGVNWCLLLTYIAAFMLTTFPDQNDGFFWCYGVLGTAILGLPLWILGCALAQIVFDLENIKGLSSEKSLYVLRALALIVGILTLILEFHSTIKYKYTFLFFSPIIFAWLYSELTQKSDSVLLGVLKGLGAASYSLYLVHKLSLPIFDYLKINTSNSLINWIITMVIVVLLTTAFYFLIEKPSHILARKFGK